MNYQLSTKARFDLINIWKYTAKNWSVEQADHYYDIIIRKLEEISESPGLGRNYDAIRNGYRGVLVKSHIVFYRIDYSIIQVIRILHQKMDYKSRIGE